MDAWTLNTLPTYCYSKMFTSIFNIERFQMMVLFCRFGLVLQASLQGLLKKLSCPALNSGQKMSLIICNISWMSFFQETIFILLHMAEIGWHKCLMLDHYSIGVICHLQFLMVRSLPCISNGGTWHVSCNGTMRKGYFFLLLSLIGFWINYRYFIHVLYFKNTILEIKCSTVLFRRTIKAVCILESAQMFHWF